MPPVKWATYLFSHFRAIPADSRGLRFILLLRFASPRLDSSGSPNALALRVTL